MGKNRLRKSIKRKKKDELHTKTQILGKHICDFFFPTEMSVLKLAENTPASHIP